MPMKVTCHCGQAFSVEENLYGKTVKCTKCGGALEIPSGPAAAADPELPPEHEPASVLDDPQFGQADSGGLGDAGMGAGDFGGDPLAGDALGGLDDPALGQTGGGDAMAMGANDAMMGGAPSAFGAPGSPSPTQPAAAPATAKGGSSKSEKRLIILCSAVGGLVVVVLLGAIIGTKMMSGDDNASAEPVGGQAANSNSSASNGSGENAGTPTAKTSPAEEGPAAGEQAIRQCFKGYLDAITSQDGEAALGFVGRGTIDYYGRLKQLALTGSQPMVQALPLAEKMVIVTLRQTVEAEQLKSMAGRDLFAYMVEHGGMGNQAGGQGIGEVQVENGTATAAVVVNEKPTDLKWVFRKEEGAWKLDVEKTNQSAEQAMRALIQQTGQNEGDFVVAAVEAVSGRPVPDTIWQPLVPSTREQFSGFSFEVPGDWTRVEPGGTKTMALVLQGGDDLSAAAMMVKVDVGTPMFPSVEEMAEALAQTLGGSVSADPVDVAGVSGRRVEAPPTGSLQTPTEIIVVFRGSNAYLIMGGAVSGSVSPMLRNVQATWKWGNAPGRFSGAGRLNPHVP